MVAIMADETSVHECLKQTQAVADIAAINSPMQTVLSAKVEEINKIVQYYEKQEVKVTRLNIPLGAHSRLVEPIIEEFRKVAQTIQYHEPQIGLVSNRTGTLIDKNMMNAEYWVDHLRNTVLTESRSVRVREALIRRRVLEPDVDPSAVLVGHGHFA